MTFLDYVKLAGTIIAGLGGGGGIVYGFSSFLGKIWADRALQDYRHKYDQLSIQLQNQLADNSRRLQAELDNASRRLQVELDSLRLVHDLRTKEEFQRLAELWKLLITLFAAYHTMTNMGLAFETTDELARAQLKEQRRSDFAAALYDVQQYFLDVMIFIPEPISIIVEDLLNEMGREPMRYRLSLGENGDPDGYRRFIDTLTETAVRERRRLEDLIRTYTRGGSLGTTVTG